MLIGKRISFSLDGVWTEDAFADTLESVSTWIFSTVERPFYLNRQARVNTILTCFGRSSMPDARTQARDQVKFYGHL